ncbi:MAG: winged helix-turn-helix transcriptional regulator [Acidobacteria bacterium]|nr:winged helix-turn-helix transcriptional regulator [Acidobacteriota bacterium]
MWLPKLDGRRPKYRAIADAIDRDVQEGALRPGARLPPHRDLADHLGVTVTTVTRAYTEAARRGLVSGHVGRGTFVRGTEAEDTRDEGPFDLSVNILMPDRLCLGTPRTRAGLEEALTRVAAELADRTSAARAVV